MLRKYYKMMKFNDETQSKIIEAWLSTIDSLEDEDLKKKVTKFTEDMKEKLFTAPASPSVNYPAAHNCMPLGFVEHTLRVIKIFRKLVNEYKDQIQHDFTNDDVIIAAMFHDMGKIGDLNHTYYLDQDSDWHRDRGMFYTINDEIEYLRIPNRSLFLLQHYGIKIPIHVYKAILLHDGPAEEANRSYTMKEGLFALLLQQADMLAATFEKNRYEKWLKENT